MLREFIRHEVRTDGAAGPEVRTVFNLLGPLTNPARASAQVVGVYSIDLVDKLAEALSMLGFAACFGRAWE